jgi:hypothetical protein
LRRNPDFAPKVAVVGGVALVAYLVAGASSGGSSFVAAGGVAVIALILVEESFKAIGQSPPQG